jgi:elongation factor P
VVKGATASAQLKDATLETGARVRVPGFVEPGDKIRVDTRTGDYLDRAK